VEILLHAGAASKEFILAEDEWGELPIHHACRAGNPACVRLLLQQSAEVVQAQIMAKATLWCWRGLPLSVAMMYGSVECLQLLLCHFHPREALEEVLKGVDARVELGEATCARMYDLLRAKLREGGV
jgi:ankyrin repeat protein